MRPNLEWSLLCPVIRVSADLIWNHASAREPLPGSTSGDPFGASSRVDGPQLTRVSQVECCFVNMTLRLMRTQGGSNAADDGTLTAKISSILLRHVLVSVPCVQQVLALTFVQSFPLDPLGDMLELLMVTKRIDHPYHGFQRLV